MSIDALYAGQFPSFENGVRAYWAPVLIAPISGSYERLVVGVVVVNEREFHVEIANALERLHCLYGIEAEGIEYAIELTKEHLMLDLSARGVAAIDEPRPLISGVEVGKKRNAEGSTVVAIAQNWMRQISSLYDYNVKSEVTSVLDEKMGLNDGGLDQLPALVMDYIVNKDNRFSRYFNAELKERRRRRRSGRSHEILIHFGGSRLVANFGTLKANRISPSVDLIKRRLWDLKVDRDRDGQTAFARVHEMIIQTPANDDPQVTVGQRAYLSDALEALEEQADQEELRLRSLHTVSEIGEHVLRIEALRVAI
ncbi:MAG: hypothetical protein K2X76_10195 [Sphingomonas sp.]|nr:hypothetical protein [Sphingomonas sp.]